MVEKYQRALMVAKIRNGEENRNGESKERCTRLRLAIQEHARKTGSAASSLRLWINNTGLAVRSAPRFMFYLADRVRTVTTFGGLSSL